ncbi:MAG TPA: hypothetical protein PLW86_04670, partial [Rhodocyclaceae bacterium]|nr:hypothetical protein [Rhodocyclaceae bacterium]
MTTKSLYTILGLEASATLEEIEAAYARLRQAGQGDTDDASLRRMAYETLRNPEQRAAYDRKQARQAAGSTAAMTQYEPARSGGGRLRLVVLLAVVALAAYWWYSQRARQSAPARADADLPPTASVAEKAGQPPAESESVLDYVPLPTPTASAGSTTAGDGAAPAAAMEVVMPTRGERKAGFDPEYLAWSSFQIRQRRSAGSGVLIGPDRILTNCHV